MRSVSLHDIVRACDRLLRPESFTDWEGAVNGLQMENPGRVTRIAAAVDARWATVDRAIAEGADLLLVHHGLFWGATRPWTGRQYQLLRRMVEGRLAVYSSHLPLDAHPRLGNNAQLCDALGWSQRRPFLIEKGRPIGLRVTTRVGRDALVRRLSQAVGQTPLLLPGGPAECRRIGVVSGGAGTQLAQAAAEGVDTFLTGEGPHWTHALAEDLGLNVLYAGHYATEVFGVKALARHLAAKFRLPWLFLDYPTGL